MKSQTTKRRTRQGLWEYAFVVAFLALALAGALLLFGDEIKSALGLPLPPPKAPPPSGQR